MLRKKTCVVLEGLHQEMYFAIGIADRAFADEQLECVVTAGLDGVHNPDSLHPLGRALDIRNENCDDLQKARIFEKLMRLERYGFQVVNEKAGQTAKTTAIHFHVEFQPVEKDHRVFWRLDDLWGIQSHLPPRSQGLPEGR